MRLGKETIDIFNKATKVTVELAERSYPIYVGENLLVQAGTLLSNVISGKKILIVTNPQVNRLYGETLLKSLKSAGYDVFTTEIRDGEQYKNLDTMAGLYDATVEANLERSSTIVALGGGIVGDITGFLAATYMRGVRFVQIPTTLLAQVDSSVGGKVGVNHPRGKNLIGAFYQPQCVLIDTTTLKTLPAREIGAGFAEVVKTALLGDANFFCFLEQQIEKVIALEAESIGQVIAQCCQTKAKVVAADEREAGLRAILNLGHTFGHAVETLTDYQVYRHGEAVAIGLVAACRLAEEVMNLPGEITQQVRRLLKTANLPVSFPGYPMEAWRKALALDKKVADSTVVFVLPRKIGECRVVNDVPIEKALNVIQQLTD